MIKSFKVMITVGGALIAYAVCSLVMIHLAPALDGWR